MSNPLTDAEKIHKLQTTVLLDTAEHDPSPVLRFVAYVAHTANDPAAILDQMAQGDLSNLPPIVEGKVADASRMLKRLTCI